MELELCLLRLSFCLAVEKGGGAVALSGMPMPFVAAPQTTVFFDSCLNKLID